MDTVKPKASTDLQRTRNLDVDPRATLLCDHWDGEDWSRLWWVRVSLVRVDADPDSGVLADATDHGGSGQVRWEELLRAKYQQYSSRPFASLTVFRISAITGWAASG